MATVGTLNFSSGINLGGFAAGLARMQAMGAGAGAAIGKGIAGIKPPTIGGLGAFGNIAGLAAGVGAVATAGYAATKSFGFLSTGLSSATDLAETLSKVDAVLGDASPAVKAFSDDMASRFGLIKMEVLDASSSFGGLGKGLGGLAGGALSDFTNQMTKAAIDLQSFANLGSLREASDAFTIGLSGEQSDVLKRLGVVLTEASIDQYALANGIKKTGGAFTEQQKFAIRSALILKGLGQTGVNALGDIDRTAAGTANQQRKLSGSFANLGTDVGKALMPAKDAVIALGNSLVGSLARSFQANLPTIQSFAVTLAGGLYMAGTAISNFATSAVAFFKGIPAMIDGVFGAGSAGKIAGFAAAAAGIGVAIAGAMVVVPLLTAGFVALGPPLAAALGFFTSAPAVIGLVGTALLGVTGNLPTLGQLIDGVGFAFRNFGLLAELSFLRVGAFVAGFIDNIALIPTNLMTIAKFVGSNFVEILTTAFSIVGEALRGVVSSIFAFLSDPTSGFTLDLSKMFAEVETFKRTLATMPALAVATAPDISARTAEIGRQIAEREAAHQASQAKPPAATDAFVLKENDYDPFAGPAGSATATSLAKAAEPKFAGAATLASADAYKTISGALAGRAGGGDDIARNGRDQVAQQKTTNRKLDRVARAIETNKLDLAVATI